MILYPNAKINLGLFVTEKREDGFHNIQSGFYPINWKDALEIIPSKNFHFQSSGIPIPGDITNNLCVKAFELIKEDFDIPNIHMHLHKVIPIGAGLGGGSADAAFALKGINELFELHISTIQLEEYARQIGSDCAFFVQNKPKYCFGKGDEFEDLDLDLGDYAIALINPGIHVNTGKAYGSIRPAAPTTDLKTTLSSPVDTWRNTLSNDFEKYALSTYPEINEIKEILYASGAIYSSMTGSGSTVFGVFKTEKMLQKTPDNYLIKWC